MDKSREIVLPGEIIGDVKKVRPGYGTYTDGENIVSKLIGIPQENRGYLMVISLSGVYNPKSGDNVIGVVTGIEKMGWTVDISSPWLSFLYLQEAVDEFVDLKKTDLGRFFDIGDIIYVQILQKRRGDVQLTMDSPICRKLKGGVILKITPSKVPRLIGKEGSMVNLIKEKTNTIIRVGKNGVVWVSGDNVEKAIKAIKLIEEKSHIIGLTDKISKFLSD